MRARNQKEGTKESVSGPMSTLTWVIYLVPYKTYWSGHLMFNLTYYGLFFLGFLFLRVTRAPSSQHSQNLKLVIGRARWPSGGGVGHEARPASGAWEMYLKQGNCNRSWWSRARTKEPRKKNHRKQTLQTSNLRYR